MVLGWFEADSVEVLPLVDLQADINGDGKIDEKDENLEIETPGLLIPLNDDDDDEDDIIDNKDNENQKEDDLINCHIVLSNYITKEGKVILKRLNDKIKVYKDKHKKQLLLPNPKSEDPDTLTWDLSDATQRKNFLSIKDNLWIEGYAVSNNSGDTGLQLTYRPIKPLSGSVLQDIIDTMKCTVVKVDVDAIKSDGTELEDEKEESEGAYVPVNNDDDDYDSKVDNNDDDGITGESDFIKLKLHKVEPLIENSKYRLVFDNTKIKVWKNNNRTEEILSDNEQSEFDATQDTTVYVEGISKSTTLKEEKISVKWIKDKIVFDEADKVNFTVYEITGPCNVPDYSIHTYKADVPGNITGIWTVENGIIKEGANTNTVKIHWNTSGPVIGKANFSPVSGFICEREVNVVQVIIAPPSSGVSFTSGVPYYSADANFGVFGPVVCSGSPGLKWKAQITLNGPSLNGAKQRGVTHIEVGFIQNLKFARARGNYTVEGIKKVRKANIEGKSYLDTAIPGSIYYYTGSTYIFRPTGISSVDCSKLLEGQDTPTAGVPRHYKMGNALSMTNDDDLDKMEWLGEFKLWITARTVDTVNSSNNIYTCRAEANWSFKIDDSPPLSILTNSNVNAPYSWTIITDGRTPSIISGTTANQALAGITFY